MSSCDFRFQGLDLVARPSGALFWPARRTLVVADLHLGKSERLARRGGVLLPPFESQATLERLQSELQACEAECLICLGDSFDDDLASQTLGSAQDLLEAICKRHQTFWITGNHDANLTTLSGHICNELALDGITLRHVASNDVDISGHYHPKFKLLGRRIPAFLLGPSNLILPAFGAYTGGLDHDAPVLARLIPSGFAILTGQTARMLPFAPDLPARGHRRATLPAARRRQGIL